MSDAEVERRLEAMMPNSLTPAEKRAVFDNLENQSRSYLRRLAFGGKCVAADQDREIAVIHGEGGWTIA